MVLFFISLCGLASAVAYRSIDPLVTSLAREFSVPVATAALVASAYALPYALGQPVLGPIGDSFGKGKLLAICLSVLTLTLIRAPGLPVSTCCSLCASSAAWRAAAPCRWPWL